MKTTDKNTLAGDNIESMDRMVKFRYFCVCYHEKNDHEIIIIDHSLNSDSVQMTETWGCTKCACGKYHQYKSEKIDYSKFFNNEEIYGKELRKKVREVAPDDR